MIEKLPSLPNCELLRYKGWLIDHNTYKRGEYIVNFGGDELWFSSLEDALDFIDEETAKD